MHMMHAVYSKKSLKTREDMDLILTLFQFEMYFSSSGVIFERITYRFKILKPTSTETKKILNPLRRRDSEETKKY